MPIVHYINLSLYKFVFKFFKIKHKNIKMTIAIGFEGSANKLGIGIIQDQNILSNIRHTYITPPGEGKLNL